MRFDIPIAASAWTKMASNTLCRVLALLAFASIALAGKRTLILVDNWAIRETHSTFFRSLRGKESCTTDIVVRDTLPANRPVTRIWGEIDESEEPFCLWSLCSTF